MNFFRGRIRTKRVFRNFFFTCLLLVSSIPLTYAWFPFTINHSKLYTTIKGKVTDNTTQKGISGAVVEVSYKGVVKLSKTTDESGNYYSREKALQGTHTITAKKDGYKSLSKSQNLKYQGKYTVDFALEPIRLNSSPQTGTVTPNQGDFGISKPLTFKTTYSDKNGYKDIKYAEFLINTTATGKNGIYLRYDQSANKLHLRNETNTTWQGGYAPGSNTYIENSYVKLSCQNTKVSGSGNDLTIDWQITFKPAFYGTKNLYLSAADISNATSGWNKKGSILIDKTVPQGTIRINDGDQYTNTPQVTLTLSAEDNPVGSGVSQMQVSCDGSNWQELEPYVTTKSWTLDSPDGQKKVFIQFIDKAGNVSLPLQASITLDTTVPVVKITSPSQEGFFKTTPITVEYTVDGANKSKQVNLIEGANTITIEEIDPAGNTGKDELMVILDTIASTITIEGITNNTFINNDITPVITISDTNLDTQTITLNGSAFTSSTTISEDGNHTLQVTASDKAKNTSQETLTFTIDKTPPEISVTGVEDNKSYNQSITPQITITDTNLLTQVITLNNAPFTSGSIIFQEGNHTLKVTVEDKAGNSGVKIIGFVIDKQSPIIEVNGAEQGKYYNCDVNPVITITGDDLSTITLNNQPYILGRVITGDENYTLQITVSDKAGNLAVTEITFVIDKTPPQITINPLDSSTNVPVQIISGTYLDEYIDTVKVNAVSAVLNNDTKTYTAQILLVEGSNEITVTAYDFAKNTSQVCSSIFLDTQSPQGTIKINEGAEYTNSSSTTLTLFAQDNAGGSGMGKMQFSYDGENWSEPQGYATIKEWQLSEGEGEKRVYVRFADSAGNWTSPISDKIILDSFWGEWPFKITCTGFSPLIEDINGDGEQEIIFGFEKSIYCLNKEARIVWKYNLDDKDKSFLSAAIADLEGDGNLEVLVVLDQEIYCLDKNGLVIKAYSLDSKPTAFITPADLDNDHNFEIIIPAENGLYCIDRDGQLLWKNQGNLGVLLFPAAVADIDDDNNLEIVTGSENGNVYCLDTGGSIVWQYKCQGKVIYNPVITDLKSPAGMEILAVTNKQEIHCLDKNGQLIRTYQLDSDLTSGLAVADIDADSNLEILVGTQTGLYCLGDNILWKYSSDGSVEQVSIADLDNDNNLEIVIGLNNGEVHCLDKQGSLKWIYSTVQEDSQDNSKESSGYGEIAIADLDKDNNLEVLYTCINQESDESTLHCINKEGKIFIPCLGQGEIQVLPWPIFRHDLQRTGLYDRSPPTTPVVWDEGEFTTKTNQLYAGWSSLDKEAGICRYEYKITQDSSNGIVITDWASSGGLNYVTASVDLSEGKTYYFGVQAKNNSGLWSEAGYSDGITVDTTAPVTTISGIDNLWHKEQVTFTLNPQDTGSGIDRTYYSLDNFLSTATYIAPVTISQNGTFTVKYYSRDKAGNTELVQTAPYPIKIGVSPISGEIKINNDSPYTNSLNVTLNFSVKDNQGDVQIQLSSDNENWNQPENFVMERQWQLTEVDGEKVVYARFKDETDNWTMPVQDTIILDTQPPEVKLINVKEAVYRDGLDFSGDPVTERYYTKYGLGFIGSEDATLELLAEDSGSGMGQGSQMQFFESYSMPFTSPEPYQTTKLWKFSSTSGPGYPFRFIYVQFKDVAGNWSEPRGRVYDYVHRVPEAVILNPVTTPVNQPSYVISGKTDYYTAVWINGQEVSAPSKHQDWSYTANLVEGSNVFTITAKSLALKESPAVTTEVVLDTVPPAPLQINSVVTPTNITLQAISGIKEKDTAVQINGNEVIPVNEETSWSYSVSLSEGKNTFTVSAKDKAGNLSQTQSVEIVLDTIVPQPVELNAFSPLTDDPLHPFSGIKEKGTSIWFEGKEVIPVNEETTWSYPVNLTEGKNFFTITTKDPVGNESPIVTAEIELDTTAPNTPTVDKITTPTKEPAQKLTGTKEKGTSVWIDGKEVIQLNEDSEWYYDVNLCEGENIFPITAKDVLGHQSSPQNITIVLDITAPVININGVEDNKYYNNSVIPLIDIIEENIASQTITLNTKPFTKGTAVIEEGIYTLEITAEDKASNTSTKTINFVIDKTVPLVDITTELPLVTNQSRHVICGTYIEDNIKSIEVKGVIANLDKEKNTYSAEITLIEGSNGITVTVFDFASNSGKVSQTIKLDTVAPSTPVLDAVKTPVNQHIQTLSGSREEDTIIWVNDNQVVSCNEDTHWQYTVNLVEGKNAFTIIAKDTAGNSSTPITVEIELDTIAPNTPTVNSFPNITNQPSQLISGTKEKGTSIWLAGEEIVPCNEETIWSYFLQLNEGKNLFTICVKDKGENQSASFEGEIERDTYPPEGTIKINNDAKYTKTTSITLTLSAEDNPGGSGVEKMQLSKDGIVWQVSESYVLTKSWTLDSPDEQKRVYVRFIDRSGNQSTPVHAAITLDTTAPAIKITSPAHGTFFKTTPITVTYTVDTEAEKSKSVDLIEGINTIDIEESDVAGNSSKDTITVILDTASPQISVEGITNNTFTNKSVTPAITIIDTDLDTQTITMNGTPFTSSTTISEDGNYTLQITAQDKAKNTSQQTLTFTIDKTPPEISVTGVEDNKSYNQSITPQITITDTNLLTQVITLNDVPFTSGSIIFQEGNHTLKVTVQDKAGNSGVKIIGFVIDKQSPIIEVNGAEQGKYYNCDVNPVITITGDDLSTQTITLNNQPYILGRVITEEGNYTLQVTAEDKAGNLASTKITFVIDKTPPQMTINPLNSPANVPTQTISGTYIEEHIDSIKINGIAAILNNDTKTYTAQILLVEGSNEITVTAYDFAKNTSQVCSSIFLDTQSPQGTIKINEGVEYTNSFSVILSLFAQDNAGGSGMGKMQFSYDGENWSVPEDYATIKEWQLSEGEGEKQVYVRFADTAGNWSEAVSDTIILDTTKPLKPAISSVTSPTNIVQQIITGTKEVNTSVWVNGSEVIPLNEQTTFSWTVHLKEGENTFNISVKDKTGNYSDVVSAIIFLDTLVPNSPTINSFPSITNQPSQIITGTKEAGTSVWLEEEEIVPVNEETTWSYPIGLQEGSNHFSLTVKDPVYNESASVEGEIVLDTITPPPPTVNAVTALTNQTTQTLNGTKEAGTSVWLDGEEIIPVDEQVSWSYPITLADEGENLFAFSVKDKAGNSSQSQTITIVRDTAAPLAPGIDSLPAVTNNTQLTIKGEKEPNTSIWVNGERVISVDDQTVWSYPVSLNQGQNSITITAQDSAGNYSSPVIVTTIVDTTQPCLNSSAKVINKNTVEISFSEVVRGAEEISHYAVSPDLGVFVPAKKDNTTYTLTFTQAVSYNTTYTILTAGITDEAGNTISSVHNTAAFSRQYTTRMYVYHSGKRITMEENGKKYFYHNDHLGGSNVITNESGHQVKYLEYHPYGETKVEEGTLDTAKKFTGKELDDSTGLYDYGARQYDARLGRFVSGDTVIPDFTNPQNLNRYSYCLNNPLKYTDSTGHTVDPWDPAFVFMDVGAYQEDPSILNAAALGVDVVLAVVPAVPAVAGVAVRGAEKFINKVDDIIKAADKVGDAGKSGIRILNKISPNDIIKLSEANITNSGKTVLGHYPGYIEKAKKMGASYFDVGNKWDSLTDVQREAANNHFLDVVTKKGDQIYLSVPKKEIIKNSSLAKEVKYITEKKGYKWVNQWSLKKE